MFQLLGCIVGCQDVLEEVQQDVRPELLVALLSAANEHLLLDLARGLVRQSYNVDLAQFFTAFKSAIYAKHCVSRHDVEIIWEGIGQLLELPAQLIISQVLVCFEV